MLAALLITLLFTGCVNDTPEDTSKPKPPENPFYTQGLTVVENTKDKEDFSKILTNYAVSLFDYAAYPQWSGKWNLDIIGNDTTWKTKLLISHSSDEDVVTASVSAGNNSYVFATTHGTAYYNFNGAKRSYYGDLGGRKLISSIFPVTPLTSNQKDLLRNAWLLIPFNGDCVFGTSAGGQTNEYIGNIDVTSLIRNVAAMSTTGSNSDGAGAIKKINAMVLKLINAAFDKDLTIITKDTELPKIKAKTHLVTQFNGSTETLKEIYIEPEIDGKEVNRLHIYDFSLSNGKDEYKAKSAIGNLESYAETDDEEYAELFESVQNADLKKSFKFISDYLAEITALFN